MQDADTYFANVLGSQQDELDGILREVFEAGRDYEIQRQREQLEDKLKEDATIDEHADLVQEIEKAMQRYVGRSKLTNKEAKLVQEICASVAKRLDKDRPVTKAFLEAINSPMCYGELAFHALGMLQAILKTQLKQAERYDGPTTST